MPRLPPSLTWLIDRRGRVDGEIKKIERSLAKFDRLAEEIKPLRELLASIDQTMLLHEIRIDPINIPSIRSHDVRINLPHGELTRSILLCLKLDPNRAFSTRDIVQFLSSRHAQLDAPEMPYAQLHESVRHRLKYLCRDGLVDRHHELSIDGKTTGQLGYWSTASDDNAIPCTHNQADGPDSTP
jgi:hypothetical protein